MARQEADREDMLRDGVAFPNRALLVVPGIDSEVFVGLRSNGAASIYFGADPVYHFNSQFQLRRAYVGGLLFKAERGNLVSMSRNRTAELTVLDSRQLSTDETTQFLRRMEFDLTRIKEAIQRHDYRVIGEATDASGGSAIQSIENWFARLSTDLTIADAPALQ